MCPWRGVAIPAYDCPLLQNCNAALAFFGCPKLSIYSSLDFQCFEGPFLPKGRCFQ